MEEALLAHTDSPVFDVDRTVEPIGRSFKSRSDLAITPAAQEVVDRGDADYVSTGQEGRPLWYPPAPWTEMYRGGYHTLRVPFISQRDLVREALLSTDDGLASLTRPMAAADSLGRVPWQVNTRVVPILSWLIQIGGLGDRSVPDGDTKEAGARRREVAATVEMAESFGDTPLYLPHVADFRGRLYPLAARLHLQSSSAERALLRFADPAPLGDREGYEWFMRIGAAALGFDKLPIAEQVAKAEEAAGTAEAIAANPTMRRDLWEEVDDPWMFLAWAFEYGRYLHEKRQLWLFEHDQIHVDFETALPVQLDGSCNAYQHYALLARSREDAERVNLIPGNDRPHDLYGTVADVVEDRVMHLASSDDPAIASMAAAWLDSELIDRKLCKSPVMTVSYGSTSYGREKNLRAYLVNDASLSKLAPFSDAQIGIRQAARWIEPVIRKAIDEVVGASWVRDYLKACTEAVTKHAKGDAIWRTPSGLLVHQLERTREVQRIRSRIAGTVERRIGELDLRFVRDTSTPDVKAAKQATPPNFVHSLDAAHLVRVIERCEAAGIPLGTIHDAVRVRPSDAAAVQRILLEELAAMYQEGDLLADFRDQLAVLYPEAASRLPRPFELELMRQEHVETELDIAEILEAVFAFA
jgi:DNA-directed RNA polymerase